MRAFDVLTKAEYDIRASMQPRYHLEMALLRWLHLRKLVPLTDLIEQMKAGRQPERPSSRRRVAAKAATRSRRVDVSDGGRAAVVQAVDASGATPVAAPSPSRQPAAQSAAKPEHRTETGGQTAEPAASQGLVPHRDPQGEEVLLRHRRRAGAADRLRRRTVVFVFGPQHRALRAQLEQNRPWLEAAASQLAGRKMTVAAAEGRGRIADVEAATARRRTEAPAAASGSRRLEGARPLRHRRANHARRLRRRDQRRRGDVGPYAAEGSGRGHGQRA